MRPTKPLTREVVESIFESFQKIISPEDRLTVNEIAIKKNGAKPAIQPKPEQIIKIQKKRTEETKVMELQKVQVSRGMDKDL